jgi:hypothetical protein
MDDEELRSAIDDAARAAPVNPDRARQVVARARRATRTTVATAGVTVAVAIVGVAAAVAWIRPSPSPATPADSRAPVYAVIRGATLRNGSLDITFVGGDPSLRPGELCFVTYTVSTEAGDEPDELVVWVSVHRASPTTTPSPGLHRACDDRGYDRHILIPVDRDYAVVVDGRMAIRYPVVRGSESQPT